jgi:hypothetical protein
VPTRRFGGLHTKPGEVRAAGHARGNAWLAADRPERGGRYRAYEEALAEGERAAARVERMLQFAASDSKRSQTTAEGEAPQGPASAGGSGQAREDLVPAKSTTAPDSLPSLRPLIAVSGAQLVRVRSSLRFAFRDVRDRAGAVDKALANAIKTPAAQRDGASAKDLKAGPAQAQPAMEC